MRICSTSGRYYVLIERQCFHSFLRNICFFFSFSFYFFSFIRVAVVVKTTKPNMRDYLRLKIISYFFFIWGNVSIYFCWEKSPFMLMYACMCVGLNWWMCIYFTFFCFFSFSIHLVLLVFRLRLHPIRMAFIN